jgi:hypothetical protein
LEEEMEQRKNTVEDLGRALKETVPAELKERVEQDIQDYVKMAEKGKRYVDHVRARLEFISADSESGSYKGPTGKGAAPSQWRSAAEELGDEDKMAETNRAGPEGLVSVLCGWGQLKANDSGWLTFDGQYASYPWFKREWTAYRETYHSVVNDEPGCQDPEGEVHQGGRAPDSEPPRRPAGDMGHARHLLRKAREVHGGGAPANSGI